MSYVIKKLSEFRDLSLFLNTQCPVWFIRYLRQSVCVVYQLPDSNAWYRVALDYKTAVRFYNILFDSISVMFPVFYRTHCISDFRDSGTFLGMHCSLSRFLRLFSKVNINSLYLKHYKTI